uniref:Os02g0607100 protein n=1 Tax=Macrostomum lignano TaxID=282301 RepID=A0A1I8FBP8_9PLAT
GLRRGLRPARPFKMQLCWTLKRSPFSAASSVRQPPQQQRHASAASAASAFHVVRVHTLLCPAPRRSRLGLPLMMLRTGPSAPTAAACRAPAAASVQRPSWGANSSEPQRTTCCCRPTPPN